MSNGYPTCCPKGASKMLRATGHARMVRAMEELEDNILCVCNTRLKLNCVFSLLISLTL